MIRSDGGRVDRLLQTLVCALLLCCMNASAASSQELNKQQIDLIRETAKDICTTVKEARGRKSTSEIQGEVKAQLTGLAGKLADGGISGKGQISSEEFEGFSQEATAAASQGDRMCRERIFLRMYDVRPAARRQVEAEKNPTDMKVGSPKKPPNVQSPSPPGRCRNPPPHYFCGIDGCLHRTFNGLSMGLPKKTCSLGGGMR